MLCGHGDLVAIDIDTDDPEVLQRLTAALPRECPRKKGRKGETFFVRARVAKKIQVSIGLTFDEGTTRVLQVEVLTKGQQTVLPPSLHPESNKPYVWVACSDGRVRSLYDLRLEDIPLIEGDLQSLLNQALGTCALHPHLVAACKTIARASPGARNDALNREVFALAKSRIDLFEETARKWMTEAARHAGLSETEIIATFKSAAEAGAQQHRSTSVKAPLTFTHFRDIETKPRKDWLVRDFLGADEFSCLFGQPGTGKSTIAIDLACHVASGDPWFDRPVLQGGALYVAAERGEVVKRRMAAYREHHHIDNIPLALVTGPADLRNDVEHGRVIIEYAERLTDESGMPIKLIIIETANRVLAGGDENSSVDMGKLINTLALIQHSTGAHIMIVHHSPIEGGRLRGHSSLLGALDVTIQVGRSGSRYWAQVDKSNDGPTGERISWTVESIDLHQDVDTGVVTTAPVVVPAAHLQSADNPPVSKAEIEMLKVLLGAEPAGLTKDIWYSKTKAGGLGGRRAATLTEAKKSLERKGLIAELDGVWRASLSATQREEYLGM